MESVDLPVTIPQAAEFLEVTDKTIRNYIVRGTLRADKWNGSWRISQESLREIYWKKNGIRVSGKPSDLAILDPAGAGGEILRPPSEFAGSSEGRTTQLLHHRTGRLEAFEAEAARLRAECASARKRVEQLEASAASAWAELREVRASMERERLELQAARTAHADALGENEWYRREMGRMLHISQKLRDRVACLEEENRRLTETQEGLTRETETLRASCRELRERYRRDGFLD